MLHATVCNIRIAISTIEIDDESVMSKKRAVRQKQPISIYTLAKELDVTPGTVSRALRNRPEIGIATRSSIRKRAEELGFKLRNFETRLTNICVVIETRPKQRSLFSAYVDSLLDGVWRYCSTNEIELSLFGEELDRLEFCNLVRVLGRRGANGAVFLNASRRSGYFDSLNQQNFPYCCIMTAPPKRVRGPFLAMHPEWRKEPPSTSSNTDTSGLRSSTVSQVSISVPSAGLVTSAP